MRPILLVVIAACGGGSDSPQDARPVDAAPKCTFAPDLRVIAHKVEAFGSNNGGRFDGMICIEGRSDLGCTATDLEKKFEICAPKGEFGLRLKGVPFESTLYLHGPDMFMFGPPFTVGDADFVRTKIWEPAGGTFPPTTDGNLVVLVLNSNNRVIGAQVAVLPSAGLNVRYLDDLGETDPQLTATTGAGLAVIPNVPVGDIDIQVTSSMFPNCKFQSGGYVSPDNSQDARVKIVAGATVVAAIDCTL